MEKIPFALKDVIDNIVMVVTVKAKEKNIGLTFKIEHDVPRQLLGDPLRLAQVLISLGTNAVKFSHKNQKVNFLIRIAGKEEDIPAKTEQIVVLRFDVIDNGVGMTEEELVKLFKDFSQANPSVGRKYGGTGLGLVISKKIIQMMNGNLPSVGIPCSVPTDEAPKHRLMQELAPCRRHEKYPAN